MADKGKNDVPSPVVDPRDGEPRTEPDGEG